MEGTLAGACMLFRDENLRLAFIERTSLQQWTRPLPPHVTETRNAKARRNR